VWQRRQKISSQQATIGPAPIEEVERMEAVMVCSQQRTGSAQRNLYTMDINRGRNCCACRGFGHLARHCRNRRVEMNRRIEQVEDNSNLNGDGGLVGPN